MACSGNTLSGGYNIESPGNTCNLGILGDQTNVTPGQLNLAPLADNGGPTETHALRLGSVALDVVPAEDCINIDLTPLTNDQRGEPRPAEGTEPMLCDVGAFELQP